MSEPPVPLPRLGLFVSRFPPPVGFMDGCEIIDCLFPIWWGAPFHDLDIEIDGSPLSSMPRLAGAASAGQIRECIQVVFDACEAGWLECVVPSDGQDSGNDRYFRIVPAVWSGSDVDDWEDAFVVGEVQRLVEDSLSWMNGKPLLFRQDQATEWLRGLRSPHLLPKPLLADPATLPQGPYATLSEAVSWLAYGEALDHRTLFARRQSEHDRVAQYAESESRPEAEAEFGLWFASYLASFVRLENVHRILRDAMARGELDTKAQNGDVNLQGVQFARHALVRLWGHGDSDTATRTAQSQKPVKRTGRRGRKPSYDWTGARAEFDRLIEYHGDLTIEDSEWSSQADVERAIAQWFFKSVGREPAESTIRTYVTKWLAQHEADKARN